MLSVQLMVRDAKDLDITALIHNRVGHVNIHGIISSVTNNDFIGQNAKVLGIDPNYFFPTRPIAKSNSTSFPTYSSV